MNHEIKALGELRAEFERVAALGVSRRRWVLPRWRPVGVTILVVLAGATGALAAAGLIHFGKPVGSATGKPPAASAGNGAVKPASVRLLAVHAQDPGGGLWWGMRFTTTTRALGCLEVGREQDGTIGVIGQDNAFHNDGAFHPLPAFLSPTSPDCAPLDRQGRLILNESVGDVPASGLNASGLDVSGSCLPPNAHKPGGAFCPVRDERNLYYGLLGPQATRITYTAADGASHTLTPVGPDGASARPVAPLPNETPTADGRPGGEMARLAWCPKAMAGLRKRQWCRIEELKAASIQWLSSASPVGRWSGHARWRRSAVGSGVKQRRRRPPPRPALRLDSRVSRTVLATPSIARKACR